MEVTEAAPQSKWILPQISNKNKMTYTQLCAFPTEAGWLDGMVCWAKVALCRDRAAASANVVIDSKPSEHAELHQPSHSSGR